MKQVHFIILVFIILLITALTSLIATFYKRTRKNSASSSTNHGNDVIGPSFASSILNTLLQALQSDASSNAYSDYQQLLCNDTIYCSIPMPSLSFFKFDPPTDPRRWRIAQIQAASNEHILLKQISRHIRNPFEYIDGDSTFRSIHHTPDFFVDTSKRDFSPITSRGNRRDSGIEGVRRPKAKNKYPWEQRSQAVLPVKNYDFRMAERAAIVKYGYHAFHMSNSPVFTGPLLGEAYGERSDLYTTWNIAKKDIDTPYVFLHLQNENWGLFSTHFPNRTIDWGSCCNEPHDQQHLDEFLNHHKLLMAMVGQHTNLTHPKLLVYPRGVEGQDPSHRKLLFDIMHKTIRLSNVGKSNNLRSNMNTTTTSNGSNYESIASSHKKSVLLFTATSNWGPRPQIIKCVSQRFSENDFSAYHASHESNAKLRKRLYYESMSRAKFCLAVPGLGYDTYR